MYLFVGLATLQWVNLARQNDISQNFFPLCYNSVGPQRDYCVSFGGWMWSRSCLVVQYIVAYLLAALVGMGLQPCSQWITFLWDPFSAFLTSEPIWILCSAVWWGLQLLLQDASFRGSENRRFNSSSWVLAHSCGFLALLHFASSFLQISNSGIGYEDNSLTEIT